MNNTLPMRINAMISRKARPNNQQPANWMPDSIERLLLVTQEPRSMEPVYPMRIEAQAIQVYCTFTAPSCKSLIINGAGEENRTLVTGLGSKINAISHHAILGWMI
jgi:hypothetical protein